LAAIVEHGERVRARLDVARGRQAALDERGRRARATLRAAGAHEPVATLRVLDVLARAAHEALVRRLDWLSAQRTRRRVGRLRQRGDGRLDDGSAARGNRRRVQTAQHARHFVDERLVGHVLQGLVRA